MVSHEPAARRVGLARVPWQAHDLESARGLQRVLPITCHESEFTGPPLSWLFLVSQSPDGDVFLVAGLSAPVHVDGVWTSSEPNRMGVRSLNSYRKWLNVDRMGDATVLASDDAAFLLEAYAAVTTQHRAVTLATASDFALLCPEAVAGALRRGARRALSATTHPDNLRRLLGLWQKPAYESVFTFERDFGGLRVPDVEVPDDPMWFDEPYECWFLGTYSLLADDCAGLASSDTHPDLVPIGIGPDDGVAYLDRLGRVLVEDELDGQLTLSDASGVDFVESILTTVRS